MAFVVFGVTVAQMLDPKWSVNRWNFVSIMHTWLDIFPLSVSLDSWTLTADLERWIQAFENKCHRGLLDVPYRERKTNEYAWQQVNISAGRQELLLSIAKRRKLSWFGHVCRHDTLPTIILKGTVRCRHRRGRPRKSWKDNIKLSSLLLIADDRDRWSVIAVDPSIGVLQWRLGVTCIS